MTDKELEIAIAGYLKKPQGQREAYLNLLANSADGRIVISTLYDRAMGIPEGTLGQIGTLVRQQMIPAILEHNFV
jgi:hypothetical protein